jgi:putative transposase
MHHPPHIYQDDTWYIITASNVKGQRILHQIEYKLFIRDLLKYLTLEFQLQLAAWVILDNHYHVLMKSHDGKDLSRFFKRFHGRVSFELNKRDQLSGRQVWHNYWDTCIRSEKDYWIRFNYIHHNPVKHGYVKHMAQWSFSSYHYYLEHKGEEWLDDVFRRYPVIDFTDLKDDSS